MTQISDIFLKKLLQYHYRPRREKKDRAIWCLDDAFFVAAKVMNATSHSQIPSRTEENRNLNSKNYIHHV